MTRTGAPDRASLITTTLPARNRGAGRWCAGGTALLTTPLLLAPMAAFADPGPNPAPPQTVSPPSMPPVLAPGQNAKPGQTVANTAPTLSEDDELILEIRTLHREMTDTITAHGLRGGVYLPLGDLARFLDLSIAVSDDGHYANGWYLSPGRTISINLRAGTIIQGGKEAPLPKADFVAHDGELWIKADRLADILPIKLVTDLRAQSVVVKTLEPFPFEQRLARDAARDRLANAGHAQAPVYERQDDPYHAFDVPISELEVRSSGTTGIAPHIEGDFRAAGDLLFMTGRLYASLASNSGLIAARAELGRRDPEAKLLGPLHATEFEMGDIATESMPVGLRGISGRGAFVTNEPLEHASVFETIDFRGELPAGFEVEIYRNDTLIGSTNTPVNGQYEFLHVPVEFGLNVFRMVFYGPQGQRREDVRRISVGDGRLAKGAFTYNVFAVQKDKTVIPVTEPGFQPTLDYGDWREGFALQYGLTGGVTVVGSGALYQSGGASKWLASTGVRTGLGAWAAKIDAAIGSGGGTAVELGLAGKVLGTSIVATHAEYGHGFVDEVRSLSNLPLTSMTQFDLAKTLHFGLHAMPVALTWQHLTFANGQVSDTAALRQTFTLGRVMATNVINYTDTAAPGSVTTHSTTGTFDLATFAGSHTQYRAEAAYSLGPHPRLMSLGGEVSHDLDANTTLRASLNQTFDNHQTQLGLSGARKFGPYALSFDSSYTPQSKTYAFTVRLGFSFGRNPLNGRMFVARPGLSSSGAVAVRAFADTSESGEGDTTGAPIGNVAFYSANSHVTSGADGTALLTGTGDGVRTAVHIDSASLPDIAMAPARPGVEVIARPGRIPVVNFAILQLSDIEGTAVYADGNRKHGVAGLKLNLINAHGHRAAHARSEGDGFVLIEQVRPGDYQLEIAPEQARNLKIHLVGDTRVHVGHKGKLVRLKIVVAPN